jgi:hypothetical protein
MKFDRTEKLILVAIFVIFTITITSGIYAFVQISHIHLDISPGIQKITDWWTKP